MLTEVVVELEDRIGALAALGELLGGEGVNIRALAVVRGGQERALAHLVLEPADVACRPLASTTWFPTGAGRACPGPGGRWGAGPVPPGGPGGAVGAPRGRARRARPLLPPPGRRLDQPRGGLPGGGAQRRQGAGPRRH